MRRPLATALALSLISMVLAAGPASSSVALGPPWGVWKPEPIMWEGGGDPSRLALDVDDAVHVLHGFELPDGSGRVAYSHRGPIGWQTEPFENLSYQRGLAVGEDGRPHVLMGLDTVTYAQRLASGWQFEGLQQGGALGGDIEIDAAGNVHAIYQRDPYATWALTYARRDAQSETWAFETIDSHTAVNHHLELDSSGRVHVLYGKQQPGMNSGDLRYGIRETTGSWSLQTLRGDCGTSLGFHLDAQDRPHVSCWSFAQNLVYGHFDGVEWSFEEPDPDTRPVGPLTLQTSLRNGRAGTSLVVDDLGRPHLAYTPSFDLALPDNPFFPQHLKYAVKTAAGWVTEEVDRVGSGSGAHPRLELDSQGRPHISYTVSWWSRTVRPGLCTIGEPCHGTFYAQPVIPVGSVG